MNTVVFLVFRYIMSLCTLIRAYRCEMIVNHKKSAPVHHHCMVCRFFLYIGISFVANCCAKVGFGSAEKMKVF